MRNRIFGRREEFGDKINPVLEQDIFRHLEKAELLFDENPELGWKFIDRAEKLYWLRGYNLAVQCKIDDVHFLYSMDLNDYSD